MHVFGTETHMTAIVGMALGKREIPKTSVLDSNDAASKMFFNSYDVSLVMIVQFLHFFPGRIFHILFYIYTKIIASYITFYKKTLIIVEPFNC